VPIIPNWLVVVEHHDDGPFTWDPSKIEDYLFELTANGEMPDGQALFKQFSGKKPALNANILEYVLARPFLIPEEWKGRFVFFNGTIYRSSADSGLWCRCLGCHPQYGWGEVPLLLRFDLYGEGLSALHAA
jgi:hypothetical protein